MESVHESVLLHEVVEHLVPGDRSQAPHAEQRPISGQQERFWLFDGTLGGAGHTKALIRALQGNVDVIGVDRDMRAVERARASLPGMLSEGRKLVLECASYGDIDAIADGNSADKLAMVLLDLGISSDELETSGRGFSFKNDEPLLMTMGDPAGYPFTAETIVNGWAEEDIANVIFGYGEDRFARRIARAIVGYREKKHIATSGELAEIVKLSYPIFARRDKIHPATKTFQALRIAVNGELDVLKKGLDACYRRLDIGGRMAVISFHSLEDRIVKNYYRAQATAGALILTKRPIVAGDQEIAENPRSRSAKLRVIEKR